ncbi:MULTISPECIES: MoaD/ThiS family protein [Carboxydocella]|uniref:Molybdopterin converting factor, small subunit n=2 Tax=Carboxydocella TaxID=178898 RepID=A0A1T4SL51_9FIRM|nr:MULTISPECIES: MoaD/ThiS family protein [Carboxydocella]AVX21481.1 Molybdopterin converting factor, small subunit [Carboxydocella thermautotrophica]AVX31969.1 Molybdopterin converting factor, small subunit [Carboxydocella thermautotrophica]SKA29010.1 Molybdopterin converting factor, small subunit [Carboxydocella sporoproducens DSM 16521]GAW29226.1 molybdopterin synthase sulfur carrier subunit [Carboxydocella sp. ULO1]GAW32612.1 molybdopterin synthase sulfur carrier subunit [Carboxydocella sp
MKVTVKLFATLRTGRFKVETREYPEGTTVGRIVEELGIPEEELALILVNGRDVELEHQLTDGDTLSLFPPVGGG